MFSEHFHIFKALIFSKRSYFQSAHIFRVLIFSKSFYSIFSKCKQVLIFYSGWKPVLIFYSSKYETVSNFCFKTNFLIIFLYYFLDYFEYVSNASSNYVQNF
jgi:hypothetical protein